MDALPGAFSAMASYPQFIVTKVTPDPKRPGKTQKYPFNIYNGEVSNAHDSTIWLDASTAIETAKRFGGLKPTHIGLQGYGVGFVITEDSPFFFIDIDDCVTPANDWTPAAKNLMARFSGCAIEVSQSGRGLHLIGSYKNIQKHRCKSDQAEADLYTKDRFIALTGIQATGNAGADFTLALNQAITDLFPPRFDEDATEWTTEPRSDWSGPDDIWEVVHKALKSESAGSAFGNRASFADLYTANVDKLSLAFPDDHGGCDYDESRADAALAQHLAFWTGGNCEAIEEIMLTSALNRHKWDNRPGYLKDTILKACSMQKDVYQGSKPISMENAPKSIEDTRSAPLSSNLMGTLKQADPILSPQLQIEYFKGCVYVTEVDKILTPEGDLLGQSEFKATYGGWRFSMDIANTQFSKNAWEVFTQSLAVDFPKVRKMIFRPNEPPRAIIDVEGVAHVNSYTPCKIHSEQGDVTPFLTHLAKLLPNKRDQDILLAYMAACVQYKGIKFQWAPLIQGVEGNGKTLISEVVAYSLGQRYSHRPKASDIANKFNWWLLGNLFASVEDVYLNGKKEVIEVVKPMITNVHQEIQKKGADQLSKEICCNFIFNSNYKDAVLKTKNDRRFCVFYTAQQHIDHLVRDGMGGGYFPKLYSWLREIGYAYVADFLQNYPIPDELNPATECPRAPETSSNSEALIASLGAVEQNILEAIEEGRFGFKGGFISSYWLNELLTEIKKNVSYNRRREILELLGYVPHPGLNNGRTNAGVISDGNRKVCLYVKPNHASIAEKGSEVAKLYEAAQNTIDQSVNSANMGNVNTQMAAWATQ